MTKPRRPPGLKQAGAALWRSIERPGLTEASRTALGVAARLLDEIREMETALETQGVTVVGSKGQPRSNHLVNELRQHRLALLRALNAIELPAPAPAGDEELSVAALTFRRLRRRALARKLGLPMEVAEHLRLEDEPE